MKDLPEARRSSPPLLRRHNALGSQRDRLKAGSLRRTHRRYNTLRSQRDRSKVALGERSAARGNRQCTSIAPQRGAVKTPPAPGA